MAIEYPVAIKFKVDKGELTKVKKEVDVGVGSKASTTNGKQTGILATIANFSKGIFMKIAMLFSITKAIFTVLQPILDLVNILVFVGILTLVKLFLKFLGNFNMDTLKEFFSNVGDWFIGLWNKLKEKASSAFGKLKSFFVELYNSYLKPTFDVIKNFGNWVWENILRPAFDFLKNAGKWIWEQILLPAFEFLKNVGVWIWENILSPAFEFLKDAGVWIWENILRPAFNFLKDVGKRIWEQILKPAFNFLKDAGKWIWEQILKPAFDYLSNVGEKIWGILKGGFNYVKEKLYAIGNAIKEAIEKIPIVGGFFEKTGSEQFGGTITKTGLYMLHAGETVNKARPQNPININIVVNGSADDTLIERLSRQLYTELSMVNRW